MVSVVKTFHFEYIKCQVTGGISEKVVGKVVSFLFEENGTPA